MARIYRDAYGIPHVWADDLLDLARGQGAVTAEDRAWQLEYQRRRATGTLAAVLGATAVPWDRFARRARLVDIAVRAHDALDDESRAFVAAYVDGLNAGLHGDAPELLALGIEPEPWDPWTPLAVFSAQHVLFGAFQGKLWEHRAREVLGDDARLLSHEGPGSGSNAWAVGGGRTASGLPLVGGDPHRTFESPGVYQQVRLATPDLDVAGFTFPGVPGVQHFAHAGDVAWAITNAMADYQDLYDEGPEPEVVDARTETIEVRDGDPVVVDCVRTPRGVVVLDGIALRTASDVLGDLGFGALLPLLRARTAEDVDRAFDGWVEPVNNLVVADRAGEVRYRVAGRIPVRDPANRLGVVPADDPGTAWTGWLDPLPREDVGPEGHVVTANERRGPASDLVGATFAAPHRARRLHALIGERTDLTAADFETFHGDTASPRLDVVRALLEGCPAGPVRDAILDWDGRMDAGSGGAAAYAAWRHSLTARIAAEPVLAPLATPITDDPVVAPWLDLRARVASGLESLLAAGTPFGIDVAAHAAAALTDAEGHPATWGDTHVLTPVHAFDVYAVAEPPVVPAIALSGDADCVRCTGSAGTDDGWRGSVARYVWDLADPAAGGWVVPLGASADARSPHHLDQLDAWAAVRVVPIVRDWDRLTEV